MGFLNMRRQNVTNRQLIVTYRETNAKSTKSTTTYEYEYVLAAVVTKIDPKHLPPIWPIRGLGAAGEWSGSQGSVSKYVRSKRAEKRVRKRQNEREDTHQRVGVPART